MDGIPWALVWFSPADVARAAFDVIWNVVHGFWFGFAAGHVSWGCLLEV